MKMLTVVVVAVVVVGVVGWNKVQLLRNESLSRVCFLELGHFGLIPSVYLDLFRPKKLS
jgi:hypothetical protein